jgi:hypothetical protein
VTTEDSLAASLGKLSAASKVDQMVVQLEIHLAASMVDSTAVSMVDSTAESMVIVLVEK